MLTRRHFLPYLLLAFVAFALALLPDNLQKLLQYQRDALASGQLWRLFSGHLLHSNLWHLMMNLAGLLLAMLLHSHYYKAHTVVMQWVACALLISLALYVFSPGISIYVGLSGLLHAMLTLGAIDDIKRKLTTGWLLLAGVVSKVVYEQWQGPDPHLAQLIDANVATDAHMYGVAAALLLALSSRLQQLAKQ